MKHETEKEEILIDVSERRSKLVKIIEAVLSIIFTLLMWEFVAWMLLTNLIYGTVPDGSRAVLLVLPIAALAAVLLLGIWQLYNWARFHGKDRRREFPPQSLGEVGSLYGIIEEDMKRLQESCQSVKVHFGGGHYYYVEENDFPIEIRSLREERTPAVSAR